MCFLSSYCSSTPYHPGSVTGWQTKQDFKEANVCDVLLRNIEVLGRMCVKQRRHLSRNNKIMIIMPHMMYLSKGFVTKICKGFFCVLKFSYSIITRWSIKPIYTGRVKGKEDVACANMFVEKFVGSSTYGNFLFLHRYSVPLDVSQQDIISADYNHIIFHFVYSMECIAQRCKSVDKGFMWRSGIDISQLALGIGLRFNTDIGIKGL